VHPYRDRAPDSVLKDWAKLESAIEKWDVRGTKVAVDSEWGYPVQTPAWTEQRQSEYVQRLYLSDLLAQVPVTIVYDLKNDGPDSRDKEQNFGLFDFEGQPKLAAGGLTRLVRKLDGFTLMGKIRPEANGEATSMVAFGSPDGAFKIAMWTVDSQPRLLTLGSALCVGSARASGRSCTDDDLVIRISGKTFAIDGEPSIVEITPESCEYHGQSSPSLYSWCQGYNGK